MILDRIRVLQKRLDGIPYNPRELLDLENAQWLMQAVGHAVKIRAMDYALAANIGRWSEQALDEWQIKAELAAKAEESNEETKAETDVPPDRT